VIRRLQAGCQQILHLLSLQRPPGITVTPTPLQQVSLVGLLAVAAIASAAAASRLLIRWLPLPLISPCVLVAAWLGMCLAMRGWLHGYAQQRAQQINDGLINVLDLWVLCLGAGMSFQSAFVKVSQDVSLTTRVLHEELQLTNEEMLAGCPREEALRHLVRRCGDLLALRVLVAHIIQAERMGSSLAQTLKAYAESLRFNRRQEASEMIQKLPVKLAFPLIFFIFPTLLIVILGPSAIRLLTLLAHP